MFSFQFLLALMILSTDVPVVESMDSLLWPSVRALAVSFELIDYRDKGRISRGNIDYELDFSHVFRDSVADLRKARDLLKDAPWEEEVDRFSYISPGDLRLIRWFNIKYIDYLENKLLIFSENSLLRKQLADARALYKIWDSLDDAFSANFYVVGHRLALKRIKEAVGDDAFDRGEMPPPFPYWNFTQLR